jgi:hypothetical protein
MASGRPDLRWAAKIRAATAFCLAGAATGIGLYFADLAYVTASDESARPATAAPAAAHSDRCLRITAPAEDVYIPNGAKGILVQGTACDLGSDSGWLFDFDPEAGYYYDDYNGLIPSPVVLPSKTGSWKYLDIPIGDPGDQNKRYIITLVLASPSCARELETEPPIDGAYEVRAMPTGCIVVDDVAVHVTYP